MTEFLPLEDRTAFANTNDADIFVSIHTNAAPSHRLSGVETYFLNLASDEESMRVAARENATTQRSISDLQVILNDLMLNSKINESNRLARALHKNISDHFETKSTASAISRLSRRLFMCLSAPACPRPWWRWVLSQIPRSTAA